MNTPKNFYFVLKYVLHAMVLLFTVLEALPTITAMENYSWVILDMLLPYGVKMMTVEEQDIDSFMLL